MSIDDEIEAMENDIGGAEKATPIDYAKARGIRPQKVYRYIREGKLESARCDCGRKVIQVEEADEVLHIG